MRWTGNVACMGKGKYAWKILVGTAEGKAPFKKPTHR